MIPARGFVKHYHWGKVGVDNHIAIFQAQASKTAVKKASEEDAGINNNTDSNNKNSPFAELWFGSHPSGPSSLIVSDHVIRLDEFLAKEPEMVGAIEHYFKYNKQMPFLFKILSIAQPLSLQAHPDKRLAQVLHRNDPTNYPDANHKPELAIALTDFHVLCDFRPISEILYFMRELAPFRRVVGEKNYENLNEMYHSSNSAKSMTREIRTSLGRCFKNLMISDKGTISREAKELLAIYTKSGVLNKDLKRVVDLLESLYPGDPGIFAPFFLNYLQLTKGQAIYLQANKLHAYLKGECIECMACSDNVVRAGLTTKFRDVKTLTEMLDYESVKGAEDLILTPVINREDKECSISLFAPTEEFKVEKIVITKQEFTLSPVSSGSFLIVLNGKAATKDFFDSNKKHRLSIGFAGFIPPKIQLKLFDIQGSLELYRAFC